MTPINYQFEAESLTKSGLVSANHMEKLKSWSFEEDFPELNDEQAALFLLCCEDILELAKKTVRAYFECKVHAPEFFKDRNIDGVDLQKIISAISIAIMPTRTEDDSVVYFGKLLNTSYYNFHTESVMKIFFMCVELSLYKNPPQGLVAVIDAKGFGFMHLTRFRLGTIKKFFHFLQEGLQIKLKQIHILHVASAVQKLLMIAKPFMKKELYEMIHLHNSDLKMEDFFRDHLPAKCVPEDYSGDLPSLEILSLQTYNNLRKINGFLRQQEVQVQKYKDRDL